MIRCCGIDAEDVAEVEGIMVLVAEPVWLAEEYLGDLYVVCHWGSSLVHHFARFKILYELFQLIPWNRSVSDHTFLVY